MKEQIETLRKEFNQKLDDLLAAEKATPFEVGKWYKCGVAEINYQGGSSGFGLWDGHWNVNSDKWNFLSRPHGWQPMTPEEIKTALVKEAEKRGFKAGQRVTGLWEKSCLKKDPYIGGSGGWYYYPDCDTFGLNETALYSNGKWATIVTEPVITIGGYKAEYSLGPKSFVKFGCKKFQYGDVCSLLGYMKTMDIECVAVEGYTVSRDEIEEIKKGFNP